MSTSDRVDIGRSRKSPCRPGPAWLLPRRRPRNRGSCPSTARASIDASTPLRQQALAQRPQAPEIRTRRLGIVDGGRQQHQPDQPQPRVSARAASKIAGQLVFAARRAWSPRRPDPPGPAARRSCPPPAPLRRAATPAPALSTEWIDVEARAGLFALFDCRWPTRCQRSGRSRGLVHLRQRFLDLVLAEIDLPGIGGGADVVGGKVFETATRRIEAGSRPARPAAPRDALADVGQPGAERGRQSITTSSSCASDALGVRGVRAVRRELQVRLELGRRRRRGCLRSPAPCRADSALRRDSGSPRSPPRTASWLRRSCRRSRG